MHCRIGFSVTLLTTIMYQHTSQMSTTRMYRMPDLNLTRTQKYMQEAQDFAKMTIIASLILKFAIEQSQNGWKKRMIVGK